MLSAKVIILVIVPVAAFVANCLHFFIRASGDNRLWYFSTEGRVRRVYEVWALFVVAMLGLSYMLSLFDHVLQIVLAAFFLFVNMDAFVQRKKNRAIAS